ncbi:TPA: hypothetical protein ACH3X2_001237 [Trebouxia sp. C0005]
MATSELAKAFSGPPIHHFDLYRLDHASGLGRLDLPNSFRHAVTLLEWADKLQEVPLARLEIHISLLDNQRQVRGMVNLVATFTGSAKRFVITG